MWALESFLHMMRLEGSKIILRGGRNQDIGPLYRFICDPAVVQYLTIVPPDDEKTFGASLKHMIVDERDYFFVIAKRTDNAAVGLIRLHWNAANVGEVSYWLGREFWGRGFAAEALGKLGIFAFTELGLDSLIAHCFAGNARSLALLQKLGFEPVGSQRLLSDDPLKSHEIVLCVDRHAFLWVDPVLQSPGRP